MLARRRNPGRRQTAQSVTIQAPVGGMNSVTAASELPETDCALLYNMVGSEYGLRSRYGYREWALGLDGPGLTQIPFTGTQASGAGDRQFYTTATGIWDVSASTLTASRVVTFPITSSTSGYGISAVTATQAGHFLLYCDEANGLYIYSGSAGTWTKSVAGTTQTWAVQTSYTLGNHVVSGGNVYVVTTAGTSATTGSGPTGTGVFSAWATSHAYALAAQVVANGNLYTATVAGTSASTGTGPSGTGGTITDGTVTWAYMRAYVAGAIPDGSVVWGYVSAQVVGAIGPSLADQQNGLSLDPANLVYATSWKNRVFYVERDTARAWYTDVNSFQGTLTSFNFGLKFQHGGPLIGLFVWSYDAGSGMNSRLVGISTGGDIVIYAGTDPTSAATFGLFGNWYLPGIPAGRRIATDFGGDLLINSTLGATALSKLVVVNNPQEQQAYFTEKIGNTFSLLANSARTLPGWSISIHPEDNALLMLIPNGPITNGTQQLAYCFSTQAWSFYRDLPMVSCGVWNGVLYFSTPDGRVCQHTGYVDNVKLSDPNSYVPVNWSIVSRFENGGNANQKRVTMILPSILSESPDPAYSAEARYNFDLSEASLPSSVFAGSDYGVWDISKWDAALWAGDYTAAQPISGALGMGRDVAIAIRGQADSRTILVDIKVLFEQGGLM